MKRSFLKHLPFAALFAGLALAVVAVAQQGAGSTGKPVADTIPKKEKKIRDLDDALLELDRGEAEMHRALREVDLEKIEREVREAMKTASVEMVRAKEELARSLKEIDIQKITLEAQRGLAEAEKVVREVDMEKMRKEMKQALSKVDVERIKADIERIKTVDVEKMLREVDEWRPKMERSLEEARTQMGNARVQLEKARAELVRYKKLVDALAADGLLDKDKSYTVSYRDGVLTVNGKALSADATKKYAEFLSTDKPFTLKKEADGFELED